MYYCEICDFSTKNRNHIHEHHIIPKELKGCNKSFNTVILCSICHSMIYVEGSKSGIHSVKNDNSIIIKGWYKSTDGIILIIESQGIEKYIVKKNL
jgi:hypothetical protein